MFFFKSKKREKDELSQLPPSFINPTEKDFVMVDSLRDKLKIMKQVSSEVDKTISWINEALRKLQNDPNFIDQLSLEFDAKESGTFNTIKALAADVVLRLLGSRLLMENEKSDPRMPSLSGIRSTTRPYVFLAYELSRANAKSPIEEKYTLMVAFSMANLSSLTTPQNASPVASPIAPLPVQPVVQPEISRQPLKPTAERFFSTEPPKERTEPSLSSEELKRQLKEELREEFKKSLKETKVEKIAEATEAPRKDHEPEKLKIEIKAELEKELKDVIAQNMKKTNGHSQSSKLQAQKPTGQEAPKKVGGLFGELVDTLIRGEEEE